MSEQSSAMLRLWYGPILVWVALLVLLGLSVFSAYIPLGVLNSPINLLIAAIKVALIVIFFMRLKQSSALIRLASMCGVFWMIFMFTLTLSDYFSRP